MNARLFNISKYSGMDSQIESFLILYMVYPVLLGNVT